MMVHLHQARRYLGGYLHIHHQARRYHWRDIWSGPVSIVDDLTPSILTVHAGSDAFLGLYAGIGGSASTQYRAAVARPASKTTANNMATGRGVERWRAKPRGWRVVSTQARLCGRNEGCVHSPCGAHKWQTASV